MGMVMLSRDKASPSFGCSGILPLCVWAERVMFHPLPISFKCKRAKSHTGDELREQLISNKSIVLSGRSPLGLQGDICVQPSGKMYVPSSNMAQNSVVDQEIDIHERDICRIIRRVPEVHDGFQNY